MKISLQYKYALFLSLSLPAMVHAQLDEFLLLEKPGTKHRIRYYLGDEITFLLKGEKHFQTAEIVQFNDTAFYVNQYVQVPLIEIQALADRTKVKGVRRLAKSTLLGIPALFVFSAANNIFNTGNTPVIDEQVYYISGVFVGLAGIGYLYNGKRYRLQNRWRIIMVRH